MAPWGHDATRGGCWGQPPPALTWLGETTALRACSSLVLGCTDLAAQHKREPGASSLIPPFEHSLLLPHKVFFPLKGQIQMAQPVCSAVSMHPYSVFYRCPYNKSLCSWMLCAGVCRPLAGRRWLTKGSEVSPAMAHACLVAGGTALVSLLDSAKAR